MNRTTTTKKLSQQAHEQSQEKSRERERERERERAAESRRAHVYVSHGLFQSDKWSERVVESYQWQRNGRNQRLRSGRSWDRISSPAASIDSVSLNLLLSFSFSFYFVFQLFAAVVVTCNLVGFFFFPFGSIFFFSKMEKWEFIYSFSSSSFFRSNFFLFFSALIKYNKSSTPWPSSQHCFLKKFDWSALLSFF